MKTTIFLATALLQTIMVLSQHVGINTQNPDRPLTIKGVGQTSELMSLVDLNDSTRWHINLAANGLNFSRTGIKDYSLFLDNSGNVGIGTSNPGFPLQVSQQDSGSIIAFFRNLKGSATIITHNGSNYTGLGVHDGAGYVGSFFTPVDFGVVAGSIERIRINGVSGNVGIGTAQPSRKLEVSSADPDIAMFASAASIGIIAIKNNVTETEIGADALGGIVGTDTDSDLRFRTGNVARVMIKHPTGNMGIGTTNPFYKLHVEGKGFFTEGIVLPNTGGTISTLNYYEEVAINSNIFNGPNVYATNYTYRVVRTGKQVTITLPVEVQNLGIIGPVSEILLSGLPQRFRPGGDMIRQPVQVMLNGIAATGILHIKNDGNIAIKPSVTNPSATWASPANSGFMACTISYVLPL